MKDWLIDWLYLDSVHGYTHVCTEYVRSTEKYRLYTILVKDWLIDWLYLDSVYNYTYVQGMFEARKIALIYNNSERLDG